MKSLRHISLCIASVMALSAPLQAQGRTDGRAAQRPREEVSGTQNLTFGDELVTSSVVTPEGVTGRGHGRLTPISLLRVRMNFVNEMYKSVENL